MTGRARQLDARILSAAGEWRAGGTGLDDAAFDALALDLFAYQRDENVVLRRFSDAAGPAPAAWRDIPAVPASAFKDATLATFDVARAELTFHTSGTTAGTSGRHYMERAATYDAVLLAGFDRFMLADGAQLAYLNLVPDPARRADSSLGYMMGVVGERRGRGPAQFFLHDDGVDVAGFLAALDGLTREGVPACIAGTAFAFVALTDALAAAGTRATSPPGSRVMETGGFKGRTRAVERDLLYAAISERLGVPHECIVAEYGMTELTSQFYDTEASRTAKVRTKAGPPWLRTLVVDGDGREVAGGERGYLRHVDLANRSSAIAVQTEDRGYTCDGGFVLLGRDLDAPLRGCSLDAEALLARSR